MVLQVLGLLVGLWCAITVVSLGMASAQSIDGSLVLGGSIRREIYAADVARAFPELPILISGGSEAPCIWLIFQRADAPLSSVWLEECADSTFGNFYYSVPILQSWGIRKVRLITSPSHLPRALWLGRIILGAHGIWVVPDPVVEKGLPGNQESGLKTSLDLGRGMLWAIASQFYQPVCSGQMPLAQFDPQSWQNREFQCEHQSGLDEAEL